MPFARAPKAGVFAVRAARFCSQFARGPDQRSPQALQTTERLPKAYLLGRKNRLCWKNLGWRFRGRCFWRWKDRIDRAFMRKLDDLRYHDLVVLP